jgi:hypothetical protein
MKRILIAVATLVTVLNLALGVAYAAACESTNGTRYCGSDCKATAGGGCQCTGNCSGDELNWVSGAKKPAEAAMEELAY